MIVKENQMNKASSFYKNKLFWITVIILFPIILQVFYTGFSFSDFTHHKWITYKGNRILLFIFWALCLVASIKICKLYYKYLAIPILFSLIVSAYTIVTHENIEYEVFAAVSNTSYKEAIEFLTSFFVIVPICALVLIFIIIYFKLLKGSNDITTLGFSYTKYFFMLFIGVLGLNLTYAYSRDTLYKTYPLSIPFYFKTYYKEIILFKEEFNKIDYISQSEISNEESLYILMIGETARAQSMSVYGYPRDTTPEIQKAIKKKEIHAAVYDTVSSGVSTRLSVPLLLSTANTKEYSKLSSSPTLPQAFNGINFNTRLISNQEIAGRNSDIIALILNQMKSVTYLSESDDRRGFDVDLIPYVEDVILDTDSKATFVIVHLMGSHWKYERRYPEAFSFFSGGEKMTDTYDNSIRYTDSIIGQVIDMMEQSDKPIFLMYTSDHGENFDEHNDGNYLHAVKEMTEYEVKVPLFIASNKSFYNKNKIKVDRLLDNKGKRVSHSSISHTLLGLAGVYDEKIYQNQFDISSEEFGEPKRYSINRRSEIIDVDRYLSGN